MAIINNYDDLARAMKDAGYITNGVEMHGDWHRTTVCSKRHPVTGMFHGNSFWVSLMPEACYLGTWGGAVYLLPDQSRLVELCISWLSQVPDRVVSDFDDSLKLQWGLTPVPEDELETGG